MFAAATVAMSSTRNEGEANEGRNMRNLSLRVIESLRVSRCTTVRGFGESRSGPLRCDHVRRASIGCCWEVLLGSVVPWLLEAEPSDV